MILYGASVPFVLRKSSEVFELIGECYIHGIMHGEAFNADNKGLKMISIIG
jgi:hypothetical protein